MGEKENDTELLEFMITISEITGTLKEQMKKKLKHKKNGRRRNCSSRKAKIEVGKTKMMKPKKREKLRNKRERKKIEFNSHVAARFSSVGFKAS